MGLEEVLSNIQGFLMCHVMMVVSCRIAMTIVVSPVYSCNGRLERISIKGSYRPYLVLLRLY